MDKKSTITIKKNDFIHKVTVLCANGKQSLYNTVRYCIGKELMTEESKMNNQKI